MLSVEGVGEVEGPVAVYAERVFQAEQAGEPLSLSNQTFFAIDLGTGKKWDILDVGERWPRVQVAAGRLVVWDVESLDVHSVSLDGGTEVLFQSGDALLPIVSLDGSKIAIAVDGTPSGEADSVVVLDVQSGDELVRLEADDPRIDPPPSADDFSLEVSRWGMNGDALLVSGRGTGSFVVTLNGEVRETSIGGRSPDLRYGIVAEPRRRSTYDSLTVMELTTGRVVLTLAPEEGSRIWEWYWGAPPFPEFMYATVPENVVDRLERIKRAVWHIVDVETGATRTVDIHDKRLRAEWEWIWTIQDSSYTTLWGQCLVRHRNLDSCIDLFEAANEALDALPDDPDATEEPRDPSTYSRRTELLGIIWID